MDGAKALRKWLRHDSINTNDGKKMLQWTFLLFNSSTIRRSTKRPLDAFEAAEAEQCDRFLPATICEDERKISAHSSVELWHSQKLFTLRCSSFARKRHCDRCSLIARWRHLIIWGLRIYSILELLWRHSLIITAPADGTLRQITITQDPVYQAGIRGNILRWIQNWL